MYSVSSIVGTAAKKKHLLLPQHRPARRSSAVGEAVCLSERDLHSQDLPRFLAEGPWTSILLIFLAHKVGIKFYGVAVRII